MTQQVPAICQTRTNVDSLHVIVASLIVSAQAAPKQTLLFGAELVAMLKLNRKLSNHAFESWVLQKDLVTSATTITLPAPVTKLDSGVGFLATKIRLLSNALHQINDTAYLLAHGSQGITVYEVRDAAVAPVAGAQPAGAVTEPISLL